LEAHRDDAAAVVLGAFGVLGLLALATGATGPVGAAAADVLRLALGRAAPAVPAGALAAAVVIARPSTPDAPRRGARSAVGVALTGGAVLAVVHVAGGAPALDAAPERLARAGGVAGAVLVTPVARAGGVAGVLVVALAAAALGAIVLTGTPLHRLAASALAAGRRAAGLGGAGLARLRALAGEPAAPGAAGPGRAARSALPAPDGRPAGASPGAVPEAGVTEGSPPSGAEPPEAGAPGAEAEAAEVEELDLRHDEPLEPAEPAPPPGADPAVPVAGPAGGAWTLPPRDVLRRSSARPLDERSVRDGGAVLVATLAEFGVEARLVGTTVGPTVTRYELELAPGVKVSRVTALTHDIAYAMASADVRILAPIPGRSAVGVEVPNRHRQLVTLGDVLASEEAHRATHPLEVGLGRDIAGRTHMLDLSAMPHVLISGQTGAGKSSCINSIITSLLMRCTPEVVRLILIDPKRVELGQYDGLPHLLTSVVTNPKRAANALDWAVREMEVRYDTLAEVGVRDIAAYNALWDRGELPTAERPDPYGGRTYERMPYIVVVVDELNDLMMVAARDVEHSICRLAQMARAVGIHLVIATQRPSVNVITGVIKANIPSRLAFRVTSIADSRVILDQAGAERLIGQGDMLLVTASSSKPTRIQGSWVDEACVRRVVAHWKRQANGVSYVEGLQGDDGAGGPGGGELDEDDELLEEAMELVVRSGLGSTSMLQRKLRVGFARAGRLMDLLERRGVVGPSEGSKARAVLMTPEELDDLRSRV
jgi:S-DNA-T family DNA segregation ATPase FtsK/SpoIIIE